MPLETKVVLLRSLANGNTDPVSVVEEFGPWCERDRKSKVQRSKVQMYNFFWQNEIFSGAEILFDSSEMCGLMLIHNYYKNQGDSKLRLDSFKIFSRDYS